MDSAVATKITAIVASLKRLSPDAIRPDATFDELGIDSLDKINLLFELENEFNVDIPDEEARGIKTVREMIDKMDAYLQTSRSKGA